MKESTTQQGGAQAPQINLASWERILSAGAGTVILGRSLGRSLSGTVLGAALAYRGLSGHCHLYDTLGISTADGDERRLVGEVELSRVITIDAPLEELFNFFRFEPETFAQIMTPIAEVEELEGDRYQFRIEGPLRTYESVTRILSSTASEQFEWETVSGDIDHSGSVAFKATPRGTEIRVDVKYRVPGGNFTSAVLRLTGMEPHETLERALRQVKARFEAGEVPTVEGQPMGAGKGTLVRDGATA